MRSRRVSQGGTSRAAAGAALALALTGWSCGAEHPKGHLAGTGGSGSGSSSGEGGDAGGASSGTATGSGTGTEVFEDCYDGIDGDGNGATDCIDDEPACAALCADPCSAPKVVGDPGFYEGDTSGFAAVGGTSCVAPVGAGATSVFQITATQSGVLEAWLFSPLGDNLTLSFRESCEDGTSEVGCVEQVIGDEPPGEEHGQIDVSAGQTVFVLVQGHAQTWRGRYSLTLRTRVPGCGDGVVDSTEECDDQNENPGDGCSPSCTLEIREAEPNDAPPGNLWSAPWVGTIDPADDDDIVAIDVPGDGYSLLANVFDLGSGWCAQGKLDSYLVLYDAALGDLGGDDDSGDGYCSRLSARGLSAGIHYLRVSRSFKAPASMTFFYQLAIELDECGNGTVMAAEMCDDGNAADGDGCSHDCVVE